ncbi:sigma factor-like helix-turn-helix DNA-binding protein [Alkalihalobacillus sp. FSL R5-0424]
MSKTTKVIFQSYNETIKQISVLDDLIEVTETEQQNWWIGGKLFNKVPMDNAAERVDRLTERLELMRAERNVLIDRTVVIAEKLRELDGIEYQVGYKRYVEGKTLQQIADELERSHEHIRKISSRIKV